jgi:hypothetical protein
MTHKNELETGREVIFLHEKMFARKPEKALLEAYERAHCSLVDLQVPLKNEVLSLSIIISKNLDVMGIEPWLRGKGRRHLITSKLLLLAALSECDASHCEFDMKSISNGNALLAIMCHGFIGTLRLIRGRLQMTRHGVV